MIYPNVYGGDLASGADTVEYLARMALEHRLFVFTWRRAPDRYRWRVHLGFAPVVRGENDGKPVMEEFFAGLTGVSHATAPIGGDFFPGELMDDEALEDDVEVRRDMEALADLLSKVSHFLEKLVEKLGDGTKADPYPISLDLDEEMK